MTCFRRIGILVGTVLSLALAPSAVADSGVVLPGMHGPAPSGPSPSGLPGSPCSRQSVSAINQYCENLPASTGPQLAQRTTRALAPSASGRVGRALAAPGPVSAAARQRLRVLPAPAHTARISSPVKEQSVVPLSLTLILILVAVALALIALAFERWRRRRRAA